MTVPVSNNTDFLLWHTISAEETLEYLFTQPSGLSNEDASERLKRYGLKRLSPPKKRSALSRFLLQFHNILIYVLLIAGGITAALIPTLPERIIVSRKFASSLMRNTQIACLLPCEDSFSNRSLLTLKKARLGPENIAD